MRRRPPTNANDKYYAFLRTAATGGNSSERVLVVLNFQPAPQTVQVDLSGVATAGLIEVKSNTAIPRQNPLPVDLPGYGYRLYVVRPEP